MAQVAAMQKKQKGSVKSSKLVKNFVSDVARSFDYKNGGIGKAPKFPQASTILTLLNIYSVYKDKKALSLATSMLDHMAKGGIYDQIEGGFYRYSTDAQWRIPHFEKMLYTNAELLEAYALAYKITHKKLYKKVINETIAQLKKYYQHSGLYFGASDADSIDSKGEKEEGYYYVYSYDEALSALKKAKVKDPQKLLKHLSISWEGNFHKGLSNPVINSKVKVDPKELAKAIKALKALREDKKYPFIDKKMLTAWNALLAHAMFVAGDSKDAQKIVDAILDKLYKNGVLYHQKLPGKTAKVKALMEDYAFLIMALLDSYQASQDKRYLNLAKKLTKEARAKFKSKGLWFSSNDAYKAPAAIDDGAYRNALAVMGENLLRLEILSENPKYGQEAKQIITNHAKAIKMGLGSASGVKLAVAKSNGYIIVRAPKEYINEVKKQLSKKTNYPFISYQVANQKEITACTNRSCFASAKSVEKIVKQIVQEIKRAKVSSKVSKKIKF